MARLPICLSSIDSRRAGGCQKPGCAASDTLHRHHKRHEAMWLGIWSGRRRTEAKWKAFVNRYYSFLPEDCVILCANHHAEIHVIYDGILLRDRERAGKPFSKYTWPQAETLMLKFEAACDSWMRKATPGVSSTAYGRKRKRDEKKRKHHPKK